MSTMDAWHNGRGTLHANEETKIKKKKKNSTESELNASRSQLLRVASTFEGWSGYIHTSWESSKTHDKRGCRQLLSSRPVSSNSRANHVLQPLTYFSSIEEGTRFLLL